MSKELLYRVRLELLDVVKSVNELEIHHDGDHLHELLRDVEAALAEQDFHLHDEENEGGWSDWICPKPDSYLMKCCDCGLVHEMQTRVVNYESRPSEDFVVSTDPNLQTQFRMRRHEVLKTTPPQRTEPLIGCVNHDCAKCKEQQVERNFCSRCGKRTPDLITIHTCTPPQD
jgi:hypothetical protein